MVYPVYTQTVHFAYEPTASSGPKAFSSAIRHFFFFFLPKCNGSKSFLQSCSQRGRRDLMMIRFDWDAAVFNHSCQTGAPNQASAGATCSREMK